MVRVRLIAMNECLLTVHPGKELTTVRHMSMAPDECPPHTYDRRSAYVRQYTRQSFFSSGLDSLLSPMKGNKYLIDFLMYQDLAKWASPLAGDIHICGF